MAKRLSFIFRIGYALDKLLVHQQIPIVTGAKSMPWVQHGMRLHVLDYIIHQLGQAKPMSNV
jgi:response regulator of citrate/malate metabolism